MCVQLLPGCYLSTILLLVHLLKSGKSDYCSAIGETGVAEKQICGTQESFKSRAINVYSHGIPNGVTQCICKVDLPSSIKYLSVGYYINSSGKDGCGLKVNLGNSGSFSCRSQRHANVSRFNDIRFSRASDSSPNMCLEIRSAAPIRIQCQPSPINYIDTESKESEAEDLDDIPSTKTSTRQAVTVFSTRQSVTSSPTFKDSSIVQSSTPSISTTRRPSSRKTSTKGTENDRDTTFSLSFTTATSFVALTELPGETTSVSVNDTTDPLVVPVGEYKDTAILVGIFVPLMVLLIVMTAFCIRYKYKKRRKGSILITEDSATSHQLDTSTDDKKTEYVEKIVTYNVAYNMEIPPDYPDNNGSIHNTGEKCDNVNDKARDDDLVITYNVMYNVGLNNEATGDNTNSVFDHNAVGDTTYEIKENQAHIYHEINESMQEL